MRNYLTYTKEETAETARVLELQMGSPEQFRATQLVQAIQAQHDGANNGWFDCFCVETDSHHEVSNGTESLSEFAARLDQMGWAVDSIERFTAICPACQNPKDSSTWASQYQDNQGLLG